MAQQTNHFYHDKPFFADRVSLLAYAVSVLHRRVKMGVEMLEKFSGLPSYFVKSCYSKDNTLTSNTIKIGTLQEYRSTEDEQIADINEGIYSININFSNIHMPPHLASFLLCTNQSTSAGHIHLIEGKTKSFISSDIFHYGKFIGDFSWTHHNRFIFCMTGTNNINDAGNIFPLYDDFWVVERKKIMASFSYLLKDFIKEIKQRLRCGEHIFYNQETIDKIEDIEFHTTFQKVIYQPRIANYGNREYYQDPTLLQRIHEEIPFTKPKKYEPESEYRWFIDVTANGISLEPRIRHVIMSSDNYSRFLRKG
ncbi:hypothetical protein R2970_000416 [Enterobacter cloacae]|nr:hypothetical protein [Enterobacter cloacae]